MTQHQKEHGSWRPLALHFRQRFNQGYRYLDNCGAFILDCEQKLDFVPAEAKPTGAKLEKPEKRITVNVDSAEVKAAQEDPSSGGEEFAEICAELGKLVQTHFPPALVYSNGFAWRSFRPFTTEDSVKAASLEFTDANQEKLAEEIGMISSYTHLHQVFTLGSKELTVQLAPITFDTVTVQKQNPRIGASKREKEIAERRNQRADQVEASSPYGLSINVDLVENDPPVDRIKAHFDELVEYRDIILRRFSE